MAKKDLSGAPRRSAFVFTEQTEARSCPVCFARLDAATGVSVDPENRRPRLAIGDITACAYCGAILTLTTIGFRSATPAEIEAIDPPLRDLLLTFPPRRPPQ